MSRRWVIGDECEVRIGGRAWVRGEIWHVRPDGIVRVYVPSEDMTVPRATDGTDAGCFREIERPA